MPGSRLADKYGTKHYLANLCRVEGNYHEVGTLAVDDVLLRLVQRSWYPASPHPSQCET